MTTGRADDFYERWGATVAARQCPATVHVSDDRWGGFTDRCDRPAGHDGEHRSLRTATNPRSWLAWRDADQPAVTS